MDEEKFSKDQILGSKRFSDIEKDILLAILEDKEYILVEVTDILDNFNKKEVI